MDSSSNGNTLPSCRAVGCKVGRFWKWHVTALVVLVGFTVFTRLLFVPEIGTYGDDTHKWLHAKMLNGEIPLSEWLWDHHTARTAIMGVTWIVQALTGSEPMAYFVPGMVACLGMALSLYFLGARLFHPLVGLVAGLALLTWTPDMFYQLMPSPFMSWFSLMALLALIHACGIGDGQGDIRRPQPLWVWVSAVALLHFLAYLSWIGALFFMPVFGWILWRKNGWKALVLYAGVMAGLYLTETLIYAVAAGIPFGRLEIISWYHMTDMERFQPVFLDLFRRFNYLYGYPRKVILPFLAILPFVLIAWRRLPEGMKALLLTAMCFLFFLTFSITSVAPVRPFLLHTQPRYSYPVYPLALLVFSGLGWLVLRWTVFNIAKRWDRPASMRWALPVSTFAVVGVFVWINTSNRFEGYSWADRSLQLSRQKEFSLMADQLEWPVIQMGRSTPKALKYYADILLDRKTPDGSARPTPPMRYVMLHARPAWVMLPDSLEVPDSLEEPFELEAYYHGDLAVFVTQFPFRISVGSAIQVGISPRAVGGRKVRMKVPDWTDPIEWLLDEARFASGGVPLPVKGVQRDGVPWRRQQMGSLADGLPELASYDSRGGHGVGELCLRFSLPEAPEPGAYVATLIQTGPVSVGFNVKWRDADTGEMIFEMDSIPEIPSEWLLVKLPVAYVRGGQSLEMVVTDSKPDFGAWIGVTDPMLVNPSLLD
ncbi:MAG: hypothetical protein PHF70_05160 [Opitutales bacterium]|nr:hypothetical protein [Opitutales bacterium]